MKFATFDTNGLVKLASDEPFSGAIEIPPNLSINDMFYDGKKVGRRETVTITPEKSTLTANNADTVVLKGLPADAKVIANNELVTGAIKRAVECRILIELAGKYRAAEPIQVEFFSVATQGIRLRAERDKRLAACDWTQMNDAPMLVTKKAEWAAYRQKLRDIPKSQPTATLETVSWPTPPADGAV